MLFLQCIPVVLSFLVLAAHFGRHDDLGLAGLSVGLLGLLAVPRRWAARTLQVALLVAAAEWVRTLIVLAGLRAERGQDATRLVIILGAVAAFTAASALALRTKRVRARFRAADGSPGSG